MAKNCERSFVSGTKRKMKGIKKMLHWGRKKMQDRDTRGVSNHHGGRGVDQKTGSKKKEREKTKRFGNWF